MKLTAAPTRRGIVSNTQRDNSVRRRKIYSVDEHEIFIWDFMSPNVWPPSPLRENRKKKLSGGSKSMAQVCRKVPIGHSGNIPEAKTVWQGIHSKILHRTSSIHVYAEFCGPNDAMNQVWGDITNCAVAAGVAAGIAAIVASPGGALPAFAVSFKACLIAKVGHQIADQLHVSLSTKQEPDNDWH
ncbi:MAG: hypothetical protein NTU79_06370 [Planctomycetota bacterium]|nr:hypothetical protein [Planctomycetota bacterium]